MLDDLLLTAFQECNVPPPMSQHQLKHTSQVNCIAFDVSETGNNVICQVFSGDLHVYRRYGKAYSPGLTWQ
jgi:hypothetical protein